MGKYDLVKAVTQKRMRILKNPSLFGLDRAQNILLLKKNGKKNYATSWASLDKNFQMYAKSQYNGDI